MRTKRHPPTKSARSSKHRMKEKGLSGMYICRMLAGHWDNTRLEHRAIGVTRTGSFPPILQCSLSTTGKFFGIKNLLQVLGDPSASSWLLLLPLLPLPHCLLTLEPPRTNSLGHLLFLEHLHFKLSKLQASERFGTEDPFSDPFSACDNSPRPPIDVGIHAASELLIWVSASISIADAWSGATTVLGEHRRFS